MNDAGDRDLPDYTSIPARTPQDLYLIVHTEIPACCLNNGHDLSIFKFYRDFDTGLMCSSLFKPGTAAPPIVPDAREWPVRSLCLQPFPLLD